MSFLNKFRKEFDGLNLSERLQGQQGGSPAPQANGQNYQPYGNNSYPNQYQGQQPYQNNGHSPYPGAQQAYNPGQNQHDSGFQPYNSQQSFPGQQSYGGHQPYNPGHAPSHSTSSHTLQQPQHQQRPSSSGPISPPGGPMIHSPPAALTPYGAPSGQGAPCPTPPRWIAHWSEHDRQWYYVETSGRSAWQAPSDFPPLAGMPAFPGSAMNHNRGNEQTLAHPPQPQYANPGEDSRPSLQKEGKKSSSQMLLSAAGGFAAGGVAGYFVKDRIDKRKAKKRHGRDQADFADFSEYPELELNLWCNVCDQTISGPYAHCKKCDGGDYDICRDCLAQGQICDGKGKHSLVKVYPKCNDGQWDTCQRCFDRGYTCHAPDRGEEHDLTSLYIPDISFKKKKGGNRSDTSSSSDSD
ncbi:hypothetical protein FSARC_7968 [Fusarium sarcochroum]|uniref:WW domain-containing protein n=1 Tax=Fusarium sarcochroum TaxID=1208366 RepID=A0A8H4X7P9_9HYPO|nr:hypothetical protein FSARC_7968 [Fusarium sarcochroum]